MQWSGWAKGLGFWRRQRASAWGAMLDEQEILLVALSRQQTGGIRVVVFEHLHAPEGLVHLTERDSWWVQTLRQLGSHLPSRRRSMAIALGQGRCREGVMDVQAAADARQLAAQVQLEAASAWGVGPQEVGFDYQIKTEGESMVEDRPCRVVWAACQRQELEQWQQHARSAGWRLLAVEPQRQALERAALCLRGDGSERWADSPQDWQFDPAPQRAWHDVDWARLQAGPLYKPLVACGAALGGLL